MKKDPESALLTVAAIRSAKGEGATEILFNERQSIFTLGVKGRAAEESPQLLRHALRRNQPVRVLLDGRRSLVTRLSAAAPAEIEEFHRGRALLDQPDRTLPIDVSRIDPTVFNVVGHHLKFRSFRLCTRIIPSYTTARNIFDFCAQQSCHLPGPYGIAPCIPFQYVRDGCYARAHKMRWIITTRYRYCCEKVFSFANQNADTLAVKADKWGGCCVTWWYHVAPLVRVRIKLGRFSIVLAMVIDPGMFNKPVLLSTWLSAQENTACSARARVSMYSIQPGSAYSPANYAGTAFTTDPLYAATNATLLAYQNLVTCP
jgi:hypothetical protein